MPTSTQIGTSGRLNDKIGGIPRYHYLNLDSKGLGQAIRLFFMDAKICFIDVRYSVGEWRERYKEIITEKFNPMGSLPVFELDGHEPPLMTQSYAILRHFARVLGGDDGGYDGNTEAEKVWVDRICDVVGDWRGKFAGVYFTPERETLYPPHVEKVRPRFLKALERLLSENEVANKDGGGYVCGGKFTYVDVVLFQILHDEEGLGKGEMEGLNEYPRLRRFMEAVKERPNVKAFLEGEHYKG